MDDDLQYTVIITKDQQIPVQSSEGIAVTVMIPGDKIKREVTLDVTEEEFGKIQEMAKTNSIPNDILSDRKAPEA